MTATYSPPHSRHPHPFVSNAAFLTGAAAAIGQRDRDNARPVRAPVAHACQWSKRVFVLMPLRQQLLVPEVPRCVLFCELLCSNAAVELAGVVSSVMCMLHGPPSLLLLLLLLFLLLPPLSPTSQPTFSSERQKTAIDTTTPQAWVQLPSTCKAIHRT